MQMFQTHRAKRHIDLLAWNQTWGTLLVLAVLHQYKKEKKKNVSQMN